MADLLEYRDGRGYLSSEKFRNTAFAMFNKTVPFPKKIHGPCEMLEIDSLYKGQEPTNSERDFAYVIPCCEWPVEAGEWKMRKRLHGWPSNSLIQKISKLVCHVAGVGNAGSDGSSIEWRQSVLLSERALVWSFNDTQIQCYVIMKQLVKTFLEPKDPKEPDKISSYNIKTLIFWISEEDGLDQWKPQHLIECVMACLNRLAECIAKKTLPHYFMRKVNLFHSKFATAHQRQYTIDAKQKMQDDIIDSILKLRLNEKLGKLYTACDDNCTLFEIESGDISMLTYGYQKTLSNFQTIRKFREIFAVLKRLTMNFSSLFRCDENLRNRRELSDECDKQTLSPIAAYVDVRKGFTALSKMLKKEENMEKPEVKQKVLKWFHNGLKLDLMSGPLYLATYYLHIGDIGNCLKVVDDMMKKLPRRMIYIGFSSADQYIGYEDGKLFPVNNLEETSVINENMPAVYDVLFFKDDYNIVPNYIAPSCVLVPDFGDKYITIHPCIYALFLQQYAISIVEETQVSFNQLETFIKEHNYTALSFHSYNLLAVLCMKLKRWDAMLDYFAMSISISSTLPSVQNAAIWWLAILTYTISLTFQT